MPGATGKARLSSSHSVRGSRTSDGQRAKSSWRNRNANSNRDPQPGIRNDPSGFLASVAVPDCCLPGQLHRPCERWLRRASNEQGGRHRSQDVWPRRRHLLSRLFPSRSAEQPGPAAVWRAHLDRPYHDHVGRCLCYVRTDWRTDFVPSVTILTWRCRSWLLPWRDPLHHLLVSRALSGDHRRHLYGGPAGGRPDWLTDLGCYPLYGRHPRTRRLAVDFHSRSRAGGAARNRDLLLFDRWTRACLVAGAWAAPMVDGHAGD